MTSDNKGHGRSFIRRQREHHPADDAAEGSANEGKAEAPVREAASTTQGKGDGAPLGRERIVVPRHERGAAPPSGLDIELREVRKGLKPGDRFLRVVPKQRLFTRDKPGHIEATRLASKPRGPIERFVASVKSVVLGSPFATAQAVHERLSKTKALAVFSSDALSSSAYATEEILLVLVLAGSGALKDVMPIALVIGGLLVLVAVSYQQTIRAYPNGGGAYIVAHENLGQTPGLIAASALMVDYVLTVSVSVAAGVAAITSAAPELLDFRILLGVLLVGVITVGNLRGVRESGTIFAAPTYFFIVAMSTVIILGFAKVVVGDAPGTLAHAAPPEEVVPPAQALTFFLVLKAFSSGCAALTGIEAISNGVPAFKPPESRNARQTLLAMAGILLFLFLSITFLSSRFGFVPTENETIVSELGKEVLGQNILYYGYQVATALVLILAANTSYADFPRLSAILARDKFMPRQFAFKGDRLAFSNGIMLLAASASIILIAFGGQVSNLIPLYAVGVFVSFTLSQSGMVRHWLKLKESGWRASLAINAVGACGTAVVALVIGGTKFLDGAWLSILMMVIIAVTMLLIHRHYEWFERRIRVKEGEIPMGVPTALPLVAGGDPTRYIPPRDHVIVPVDGVNKISLGAIGMAREMSRMVTAVHLTDDPERAEEFREEWSNAVPDVPLLVIESPYRAFVAPMLAYVESLERSEPERITVILPSFVVSHWWERFLHNRDVLRLRPFLKERASLRVVDFPYRVENETAEISPAV